MWYTTWSLDSPAQRLRELDQHCHFPRLPPVMKSTPLPLRRFVLFACLLSPALLAGCGTSEYESRLQTTLSEYKHESPFLRRLSPATTDVHEYRGYGIRFRKPLIYTGAAQDFQHLRPGDTFEKQGRVINIPPSRIAPPFLDNPEQWQSFELLYKPERGKNFTLYTYFSFVPAEEKDLATLRDEILAKLNAAYDNPDPPFKAQVVQVDRPADGPSGADGTPTEWTRISITGTMPFDLRFLGRNYSHEDPLTPLPGRMDIYLASFEQPIADDPEGAAREFTAIVAWRAPTEAADELKFFDTVQTAMGTVEAAVQAEEEDEPVLVIEESIDEDELAAEEAEEVEEVPEAQLFFWRLSEGDHFYYVIRQQSQAELSLGDKQQTATQNIVIFLDLKVTSVAPGARQRTLYTIQCTFDRFVYQQEDANVQAVVDTDSQEQPREADIPYKQLLEPLLGKSFELTMDTSGVLDKLRVNPEDENLYNQAAYQMILPLLTPVGLENFIAQGLVGFPEAELDQGDTWDSQITFDSAPLKTALWLHNTFQGLETVDFQGGQEMAVFDIALDGEVLPEVNDDPQNQQLPNTHSELISQEGSGYIWFDHQNGWIAINSLKLELHYVMTMPQGVVSNKMETNLHYYLLPFTQ